ncbi:MAG: helix-turn-helix domain-containing protein [Chlamydiota bacterium]
MTSLGDYLRAAREERKIPIAQVARDTRVSERYLVAIEANELSRLPAVAYAKGFIKLYAEYLGLDPKPLLDQFAREHLSVSMPVLSSDGDAHPPAGPRSWNYTVIGVAAAGVIVAAVFGVSMLRNQVSAPRVQKPAAPGTEELETLPLPSIPTARPTLPPAAVQATPAETVRPKQKKLAVKAKDAVTLKVYADGALIFQGTMARGKEEIWTAAEGFDLRVSRPRAVDLTLDGKPVKDLKGRTAQNLRIGRDGKIEVYRGKLKEE